VPFCLDLFGQEAVEQGFALGCTVAADDGVFAREQGVDALAGDQV
jgi:hypothetical protein